MPTGETVFDGVDDELDDEDELGSESVLGRGGSSVCTLSSFLCFIFDDFSCRSRVAAIRSLKSFEIRAFFF